MLRAVPDTRDIDDGVGPRAVEGMLHVTNGFEPRCVAGPIAADAEPRPFDGALEVVNGATYVSAETSRRLACDAAVVVMHHDASGTVLDVAWAIDVLRGRSSRSAESGGSGWTVPRQ